MAIEGLIQRFIPTVFSESCLRRVGQGRKAAAVLILLGSAYAHVCQAQGMVLPGSFSVTPMGAANYSIPIQVPKGPGGMEPKLALAYNNQTRTGFAGPMGPGWTISGLSVITRCPRTMAQDGVRGRINFDGDDRFCLDGQRLVLVSPGGYGAPGTEYRTEIESFARITYDGSGFTVQSKSGIISEYGKTADSRIEAQGKSIPWAWPINRVMDAAGNHMLFAYDKIIFSGEYYIKQVEYGGNINNGPYNYNTVKFNYRTGYPQLLYLNGSAIRRTKLLESIAVTSNFNGYPKSNTYRITRRSGSSSAVDGVTFLANSGEALPTTQFAYEGDSRILSWWWKFSQGGGLYNVNSDGTAGKWFTDINGDGLPDFVTKSGGTISWNINNEGKSGPTWGDNQSQSGLNDSNDAGVWFVDVNGDGLPDHVTKAGNTIYWNLNLGTGIGGTQWGRNESQSGLHGVGTAGVWFIDINGDGLPDHVTKTNDTIYWNLNLGGGAGGTRWGPNQTQSGLHGVGTAGVWFIDINGDGLVDYVTKTNDTIYWNLNLGTGVGGTQWGPNQMQSGLNGVGSAGVWFVDINGDGLPDYVTKSGATISWNMNLGTGVGGTQWGPSYSQTTMAGEGSEGTWFIDIDGDGVIDHVTKSGSAITWDKGTGTGDPGGWIWANGVQQWGTGGSAPAPNGLHPKGSSGSWFIDINGDGLLDYVTKSSSEILWNWNFTKQERVSSISRTPLDFVSIWYKRYRVGQRLSVEYPRVELFIGPEVVSSTDTYNGRIHFFGSESMYARAGEIYYYAGLLAEMGTGRGLLGFKDVLRIYGPGNELYTEYRQDWPYTGSTAISETRVYDSGLYRMSVLKRTRHVYACKTGRGSDCAPLPVNCSSSTNVSACVGAVAERFFPYSAQVVEQSWDRNGAVMPTVTTKSEYSVTGGSVFSGDATLVDVITTSGAASNRKLIENEYFPADTSNGKWILGRLKRSRVTSTSINP